MKIEMNILNGKLVTENGKIVKMEMNVPNGKLVMEDEEINKIFNPSDELSDLKRQKEMVLALDVNNPEHVKQYAHAMGLSEKAAKEILILHQNDIKNNIEEDAGKSLLIRAMQETIDKFRK